MDRVRVAARVSVVDVVAVRVAVERVVLGREDVGHAGGRRHGMVDDGVVPVGLAHRVERWERVLVVHGWGHGAGLITINRRDLVLLLNQAG